MGSWLLRMIREIKVSSDWFGYVHFFLHCGRVLGIGHLVLPMYNFLQKVQVMQILKVQKSFQ